MNIDTQFSQFILIFLMLYPLLFWLHKNFFINSVLVFFIGYTVLLILFMYSNMSSNFNVDVVANNSNALLPFIYKISSLWSNHEGSLLLWVWLHCFWAYTGSFIITDKKQLKIYICVFIICLTMYTVYIYVLSNPFNVVYYLTLTHKGLNPLLQDPGLAIHPPMLYLGTSGCFVLFLYSCIYAVNFYSGFCDSFSHTMFQYLRFLLLWLLFFLTLGLTLGSWWAYHELGWGGWWFWDPVENMALVPWLLCVSILHYIKRFLNTSTFNSLDVGFLPTILALPYIVSLVGMFLVRGGLLDSVHAFAFSREKGFVLGSWTLVCILLILFVFILNVKSSFKPKVLYFETLDDFLKTCCLLMLFVSLVVLIFTLGPKVIDVISSRKIIIGSSGFNKFMIPVCILALSTCFLYYSLIIFKHFKFLYIFAIATVLIGLFCYHFVYGYFFIYPILGVLFSSTLIFMIVIMSVYKRHLYRSSLAHIGMGLLCFSVILNTYYIEEYQEVVHIGTPIILDNRIFLLRNMLDQNVEHYSTFWGSIISYDMNNLFNMVVFFPEKRFYTLSNMFVNKSVIYTNLFQDIYVTIGEGSDLNGWFIRVFKAPMAFGLWLSGLIISVSSFKYSIPFKKARLINIC